MRLLGIALLCVLALASTSVADLRVGEVREVQARAGASLREGPSLLSKSTRVVPFGTRVTVAEVRPTVARVTVSDGAVGWMKTTDLVALGTLTTVRPAGSSSVATSAEISAAGRQFDESIERQYRTSRADLDAAYRALDALEAKTPPPGDAAVQRFIEEGRLGR